MYAGTPATIVEVGPGKGALTELLLRGGAQVHAVEIDPEMGAVLQRRFAGAATLDLVMGDVLETDLGQWGEAVVVGNLPYYITSPILDRIFAAKRAIGRAVVLVQLEVAHRISAQPGSRDYGYLSVVVQSQAEVRMVCRVPATAFRPPPKVESAVVALELKREEVAELDGFLRFAGLAFRQKRKTLRNNLLAHYPGLDGMGLTVLSKRAEQLSIGELRGLWKELGRDDLGGAGPGLVS